MGSCIHAARSPARVIAGDLPATVHPAQTRVPRGNVYGSRSVQAKSVRIQREGAPGRASRPAGRGAPFPFQAAFFGRYETFRSPHRPNIRLQKDPSTQDLPASFSLFLPALSELNLPLPENKLKNESVYLRTFATKTCNDAQEAPPG